MSRYSFQLAGREDDSELRRRMAEDCLPGHISISFRREPDYFAACRVQGETVQVIKCIDRSQQRIVGMASRALRPLWINGEVQRGGYLADLRAHPRYRNGTLLARGYRYLRRLHEADPVPLYYSMILDGNEHARRILTSRRAGLPEYAPLGRFLTPAVHLDLPRRALRLPGVTLTTARQSQIPAILAFIQTHYRRRQLAPAWTATDLDGAGYIGLRAEDIYLALRGGRIVGTLAAWDQRAFRQTHVERYSRTLRGIRPLYNALASVTPLKALPREGQAVPYFYLAAIAIENDDMAIFRVLLRHLYRERRRGPWHYFIGGFHETDPFVSELLRYRHIPAAGHLYRVRFMGNNVTPITLDERIPFIEAGSL
ncbi:MAG TPA: hypothetical protein ENJ01_02120 [Gammaproteobacteria bacterium]|nr:hypothetical protein [Gammaproteobacteria bacterium]